MNLPLNGRIAIVDDNIEQALPLINIFSKNNIPFSYFSGDSDMLPEEGKLFNDIRILFLDINLIDNSEHDNKTLKSKLVPVLRRLISKDNHQYVVVYWSRHESHKTLIEDEIFVEDINYNKPIAYLSAAKSDFFELDGSLKEDFEGVLGTLLDKINSIINEHPAYSYLLNWENQVHCSASQTLRDILKFKEDYIDWDTKANFILNSMGNAYLGKHFQSSSDEEKLKASFMSFSSVFKDTLENSIFQETIKSPLKLDSTIDNKDALNINIINEKLNISTDITDIKMSGNIIEFKEKDKVFKSVLASIMSFFKLQGILKSEDPSIDDKTLKKNAGKEGKKIRAEIKKSWKKVAIVVTPVCDFAQKNNIYDRIVKGVLIPEKYKKYIEDKSEAVYILPITIGPRLIEDLTEEYLLVVDYRYFKTTNLSEEDVTGLFRVRQELLAEIQSKLARHINRQGILSL